MGELYEGKAGLKFPPDHPAYYSAKYNRELADMLPVQWQIMDGRFVQFKRQRFAIRLSIILH